jgi:hypothetical protein
MENLSVFKDLGFILEKFIPIAKIEDILAVIEMFFQVFILDHQLPQYNKLEYRCRTVLQHVVNPIH